MKGEREHAPPDVGDRAVAVHGAEATEELLGGRERVGLRRVEPGDVAGACARGGELEHRLREIDAQDLGRVVIGPRVEIGLRVEPQRAPRARSSRASCALRGRRAAGLLDTERGEPRPRRMTDDAHEPAVDHRDDALDGHA